MTLPVAVALDQLTESQLDKAGTLNNLFAAMSSSALWGIKKSVTTGLSFGLYGGNISIAGVPTAIASQTVSLTANAVNYIYATSAGVVTKTTSAPTGWPGPITSPAGAIALYKLDVGASTINVASANTVCYVLGLAAQGGTGSTGPTGPSGSDFAGTRKRIWTAVGASSTTVSVLGWSAFTLTGTSALARTLASTSDREAIPYVGYESGGTAGSSLQIHGQTFAFLGNAAGRGGFTLSIRFCLESANSPANQRSFFGLFIAGTVGNVEPDTLLSIIGIAAKAGDANFSVIHNDGSGTASMATLGANFPARATNNVYELVLSSVANSGIVSYSLTDISTGNVAASTLNSDLPANTQFLAPVAWQNNGSTASKTSLGLMQFVGETRY